MVDMVAKSRRPNLEEQTAAEILGLFETQVYGKTPLSYPNNAL
jgi:hypothetical protein